MKATKIASGFAVSALAAAVSMSATAGVQVNGDDAADGSASWSGTVNFQSTYQLNDEASYQTADTKVDVNRKVDSKQAHELNANFSVEEGPFSGALHIGGPEGTVAATVSSIQYDDGAFLFSNKAGNIIITQGGVEGTSDELHFPVNGAFRYYDNAKALGLVGLKFKAQLEDNINGDGVEVSPFGFAAAFDFKKPGTNTQIMANVQMADAGVGDGEPNIFATPFFGAKIIDNSIPKTTLTATFNMGNPGSVAAADADDLSDNYEAVLTYGVKAHYNGVGANGGASAYASYAVDNQAADINTATVTAGAGYVLQDIQDKTKKTSLNVDYKMFMTTDADDTPMEVKATVRQDMNYLYATAHYIFKNVEAADVVYAEAGTQSTNSFTAKAGYEMLIEEAEGAENSNMMFAEAGYILDVKNGIDTGARFEQRHGETKLLTLDPAETEAAKSTEIQVWASYELDGGATVKGMYELDNDNGTGDDIDSDDPASFHDQFTFTASYSF